MWESNLKRFVKCFVLGEIKLFLKGGENNNFVFLFCFVQGEIKLFLKGAEDKNILMYLTQGESQNLRFFFNFLIFKLIHIVYVFLFTHVLMCSFEYFRKDRYILIKIFYLFLQLLGQESQIGICDVFGHFIVCGHYVVCMFCHRLSNGKIVRF